MVSKWMRLSDTGVLGVSDFRNWNFVGSGIRRGPGELIFFAMPKHVLQSCELHVRVCKLGRILGSLTSIINSNVFVVPYGKRPSIVHKV